MRKFFVNSNQINDNQIIIVGEDVNHIKNVLRMKIDDEITVCNIDDSSNYLAKINEFDKTKIICKISEKFQTKKPC